MSSNAGLLKFIEAQQNSYSVALSEIRNGRKISHWMWYVFPQIIGLGFSETSRFYAVKNLQEAKEYMENDILSERLIKICEVLLELNTSNAHQIFGSPDDLKLKSSMTLFGEASNDPIFQKVLDKFFNGEKDVQTLKILTRG